MPQNNSLHRRRGPEYSHDAVNHPSRPPGRFWCKRLRAAAITVPLALTVMGCGKLADDLVCGDDPCEFTGGEWKQIRALTGLGEPPPDPSNKYLPQSAFSEPADPALAARELAVIRLGQRYYFETRFSGNATWKD